MSKPRKKTDAVFEGGGVKGIGLVGALSVLERNGYEFQNLAGTSAGAIVATLVAAGYTAAELKRELQQLDYNKFKDEGLLDKLGAFGKALSLGFEYGVYEGDFFENWMETLLARKGKTTFGTLHTEFKEEQYKYKVQIIAADITDHRLLVLPGDLKSFGYDPDAFSVSRAVRMSMSIPLFFEPVHLQDASGRVHLIVDGGVLSNYPIWLLDDGTSQPAWPTIGFKLMEPDPRTLKTGHRNSIKNPAAFLKSIIGTMLDAHDSFHISRTAGDYDRTIGIPTALSTGKVVNTTDFDLTKEDSELLYQNGVAAAEAFLKRWDFEEWKLAYRKAKAAPATA